MRTGWYASGKLGIHHRSKGGQMRWKSSDSMSAPLSQSTQKQALPYPINSRYWTKWRALNTLRRMLWFKEYLDGKRWCNAPQAPGFSPGRCRSSTREGGAPCTPTHPPNTQARIHSTAELDTGSMLFLSFCRFLLPALCGKLKGWEKEANRGKYRRRRQHGRYVTGEPSAHHKREGGQMLCKSAGSRSGDVRYTVQVWFTLPVWAKVSSWGQSIRLLIWSLIQAGFLIKVISFPVLWK